MAPKDPQTRREGSAHKEPCTREEPAHGTRRGRERSMGEGESTHPKGRQRGRVGARGEGGGGRRSGIDHPRTGGEGGMGGGALGRWQERGGTGREQE